MLTFASKSRRAAALAACSLALITAACTADRPSGITAPPPTEVDSIAARYVLTSVNDQPLPAVVYAGLYLDGDTVLYHDVRVVATEGFVHLRTDGTFDQRVKMEAWVNGHLSGRPVYVDNGNWRSIPYSDLVRFESTYSAAAGVFHGLAHNRKVWLSQEITGGEAGAADNDFTYVKQP
ncbi:MAG: hypothetical protein HYV19_07235 [Gemmatimonadetes bacterium]|nr:hypothetical protein [Gemmatimonadota bacterium]